MTVRLATTFTSAQEVEKRDTGAMATRTRLGARFVVAVATIMVIVGASAPLVSAEVVPGPPGVQATANPPTSTVELIGVGSGQGVNGFMSNLTPAQRISLGYPTKVVPNWPAHNVGFAGLIKMMVTAGPGVGTEFESYCIDLLTPTNVGYDYKRGEWNEANIDNVGYVAQLLQSYSPTTNLPVDLNANQKAAAVQSAIWYLSDGYVLPPTAGLYTAVRDIVADVIARGPLTAPPAPTVTIAGPSSAVRNAIVGPFVVATNGQAATGRVPAGVTAFADAAGASPLTSPFPVTNGQQIWLRSTEIGVKNPALTVTAVATQPGGVVYLYVPPQSNPSARAQTIIQAGPLTAETDVNKVVVFLDDIGQFTITKTITGSGAGSQGAIQIDIACLPPNSSVPPFTIPANAPAGVFTTVVTGITVPTKCKVTETNSGDIEVVDVFAEPAGVPSARAIGPRRVALNATQEIAVCPETPSEQPLSAAAGAEFQASPGANFENHVETTTTTAATTTTSSTSSTSSTSTTTPTSSTDSTTTTTTGETTTTGATTTAATTTGATTTAATTTTGETTTTGATTTAATTTGATTTGATTTGATTTGATTTAAAVVPTTAPNECEFAGDTTTTATTGPETLPATGSSGSGPLVVGLIGLVGGLGLVALASRRRFFE